MIEVEAHIWYWTPDGMREHANTSPAEMCGYVQIGEVKRLLEEAHARGWRAAEEDRQC